MFWFKETLPPPPTGYTGLALELRGEEGVERPAVGKEELGRIYETGWREEKSEKEARLEGVGRQGACMGVGPPAAAAFSPTQDWDLL